ncbi:MULTISPECIES: hypothetical protein [unclassified Streptococcus]|uniref:hypothetical protein n=1 Tax=unclassified Streptococcus TaxID=2608887 RepID=UPI0008A382D7|nr:MULTISPECIES: hypothetical protein [unclassified Streptococcus]OFL47877.1 hypothetical protein HMPREF2766_01585 [Streptococcus sp. HMSC076C08]OFP31786.1 hypothetical protein HMPREF2991_03685 [Streptococcus sp. HMSC072D07]
MNYLEIRKKYGFYRKVVIVLAVLLILFVAWMVKDRTIQTLCILLINALLFLSISIIRRGYLRNGTKLLHMDLDLPSWKQYIELNKDAKRAIIQMDVTLTSVGYSYMIGDFDAAIKESSKALTNQKLKLKYRDFLESYLIRSSILAHPDLTRNELELMLNKMSISDPSLAEKTKSVSIALYDLTIAHQSNDYFEDLENEFKYQQLEITYYQALNSKLKGDMTRANELFRKLAQEDEQLYIVRKSKEFLNSESIN